MGTCHGFPEDYRGSCVSCGCYATQRNAMWAATPGRAHFATRATSARLCARVGVARCGRPSCVEHGCILIATARRDRESFDGVCRDRGLTVGCLSLSLFFSRAHKWPAGAIGSARCLLRSR